MLYACEHHDELLAIWRAAGSREIALAHLDFHDDLRGLLVDRRRRRAFAIGSLARGAAPVDAGNFLAHAVLEGRVTRIRWIHDRIGGRAWDMGIVRFENDLLALPQRLRLALRGEPGIALQMDEQLLDDWDGVRSNERLSIDWDCFASILQDKNTIASRVERFFRGLGDTRPAEAYVVYSPEYVHPSLEQFTEFTERLSRKLQLQLHWNAPSLALGQLNPTDVDASLPSDPFSRLTLALRRRGIF